MGSLRGDLESRISAGSFSPAGCTAESPALPTACRWSQVGLCRGRCGRLRRGNQHGRDRLRTGAECGNGQSVFGNASVIVAYRADELPTLLEKFSAASQHGRRVSRGESLGLRNGRQGILRRLHGRGTFLDRALPNRQNANEHVRSFGRTSSGEQLRKAGAIGSRVRAIGRQGQRHVGWHRQQHGQMILSIHHRELGLSQTGRCRRTGRSHRRNVGTSRKPCDLRGMLGTEAIIGHGLHQPPIGQDNPQLPSSVRRRGQCLQ